MKWFARLLGAFAEESLATLSHNCPRNQMTFTIVPPDPEIARSLNDSLGEGEVTASRAWVNSTYWYRYEVTTQDGRRYQWVSAEPSTIPMTAREVQRGKE